MKPDELVSLADQLRKLGVAKFEIGGASIEFFSGAANYGARPEAQEDAVRLEKEIPLPSNIRSLIEDGLMDA